MTPEQIDRIKRHEELDLTSDQLAAEMGFTRGHVCWVARSLGAPFQPLRTPFTENELSILKSCVERHLSVVEAVDLLPGRDVETIHKAARSRGWHLRHVYSRQRELYADGSDKMLFTRNGPTYQWHLCGEEAKRLVADPDISIGEAAKRLGVTKGALIGYLWRQGVVGIMPPSLEHRLPKMPELSQCMFPLHDAGEPERWCEAPIVPGRPYCARHCARAYVTSEEAKLRAIAAQEKEIARQMALAEKKGEVIPASA
jgi:hypothetical protein